MPDDTPTTVPTSSSSSATPPPFPTSTATPSTQTAPPLTLGESPLPPHIIRGLGDRSYDKRKNAALDLEQHIKLLVEAKDRPRLEATLILLGDDFCTSTNSNHRKGGLIALAAAAIGLMDSIGTYLDLLLPPILHCFDDPESRVRYYACESLYNVAKVARHSILLHFNPIFEGLCKLFADADPDVKNGANLLDRLIKDIVTESDTFDVEKFIPILKRFIRRTNPYIRQLLVGWITVLDQVPEINMLDWLPEFMDGLFYMLSDENKELKQAAQRCLDDFLGEIKTHADSVGIAAVVPLLVGQCEAKARSIRVTALQWLHCFIVYMAPDKLVPWYADVLGAIMRCISDPELDICQVATRLNDDLLSLVQQTTVIFDYPPVLLLVTREISSSTHVPTRLACLRWLGMLVDKSPAETTALLPSFLPPLLHSLSDSSDDVVLLDIRVLARIAALSEKDFQRVLQAIVRLFRIDRPLLERRGSLVIRQLCVLLHANSLYLSLAAVLEEGGGAEGEEEGGPGTMDFEFVSMMVQTLNLILLTAPELSELRAILKGSFAPDAPADTRQTFKRLFSSWCHNPVATFSLCLLSQAYQASALLIDQFAAVEVTVSFLMQIDKLVQLLESPVFVLLRLQLLDSAAPFQPALLKSLYGLLMLLPQSTAYHTLSSRLSTVSTHNHTLYASSAAAGRLPFSSSSSSSSSSSKTQAKKEAEEISSLLRTFESVQARHTQARRRELQKKSLLVTPREGEGGGGGGGGGAGRAE